MSTSGLEVMRCAACGGAVKTDWREVLPVARCACGHTTHAFGRTPSGRVPAHPVVSDALARAILRAVLDADVLGVGLLHGPDRQLAMLNARYSDLSRGRAVLGGDLSGTWPPDCLPASVLAEVSRTGDPATLHEISSRHAARDAPSYVTLTYMRVDDGTSNSLLVLVEDVTERVLARDRAVLLTSIVGDLISAPDARAAVGVVIHRAREAVKASAASLFVLDKGGRDLVGTVAEWDWTRTSFRVPLADWPTVAEAICTNSPRRMTAPASRGAETGWFEARGIAATMCIPLSHDGRSRGVLFFDFPHDGGALTDCTVAFLNDIGRCCGLALDRALS